MNCKALFLHVLQLFLMVNENKTGHIFAVGWNPPRPNISEMLSVKERQSLVVRWLAKHSGLPGEIETYQVQVGRTENRTIIHSSNVSAHPVDKDGVFTWTWTSSLPLECADHSVRIRHFNNHSGLSSWSQWKTSIGVQGSVNKTKMFPYQRVLGEGSTIMLCCVPPRGVRITNMAFNGSTHSMVSIGDRVQAITVINLNITKTNRMGVLFQCVDSTKPHYCHNYVSFPPQKPMNLSCGTTDLRTINCTWNPGREANLKMKKLKCTYTLSIKNSNQDSISCSKASSCSFQAVPGLEEYHVSVLVRNQLGEETESHAFNISNIVFPVVQGVRVSPGVMDANVTWLIQGNLSGSDFLCQVSAHPGLRPMDVGCKGSDSRCGVRLEQILPNTRYSIRVRCAVRGKLWGEWMRPTNFTTYPSVSLAVWRRLREQSNHRNVTLFWQPVFSGSEANVQITGYRVQWVQGGGNGTLWRNSGDTQAEISIGPEQCDITVQAVLQTGSSQPSHIVIPQTQGREYLLKELRVKGSSTGEFHLCWTKHEDVTCGYTVEWCTLGTAVPCVVQWTKVPTGNNSLLLPAGGFKAGIRYTFKIYGCSQRGHRLLEIQTGYSQELIPLQAPHLVEPLKMDSSSVTLEWTYNEQDSSHSGFITGYLVVVHEAGLENTLAHMQGLVNISVGDPKNKSVTIQGLHEGKRYYFNLCALTAKGSGPATSITITIPSNYSAYLAKIFFLTPLLLLLGCTILLWPQWKLLSARLVSIVSYPPGINLKTIELDRYLYETSDRLGSLQLEECPCCDIEILNAKASVPETTRIHPGISFSTPSSSHSHSSTLYLPITSHKDY